MKNIRSHAALVVAAVLLASAAAAASKPVTLALKLPKKPVEPAPTMAPALAAGPLAIALVDARVAEDPAIIGAQRSKGQDVYFWRSVQPVAPAVEGFVTELLNAWSIRVAADAELNLQLALMRYYVTERSDTFGSTYIADVRFMASLTSRDGTVLWTGEASGDSKRPGVDARAAMCNEALSYALRGALAQVLSSVKLETAAPTPVFVPPPISIEPEALFADVTRLLAGGVTPDVLVAYIEQRKLTRPLTVDEILQWKNAGIPDAAIKAATRP
jgi:hypothetical protein